MGVVKGWKNWIKLKFQNQANTSHFLNKERKIVVGKSDINEENCDTIHFACRDIEIIRIPNSIKLIRFDAFENCGKLNVIEFKDALSFELKFNNWTVVHPKGTMILYRSHLIDFYNVG